MRYVEFLKEKRAVMIQYKDYIEGSYAPLIKLKSLTENYMQDPLQSEFIRALMHLLHLLMKLHSVLFEANRYLWNIRIGVALGVMREEYALISFIVHTLKLYQLTNPTQRPKEIDFEKLIKDFSTQYSRAMMYFNTLQLIPELKERNEPLALLPWGLIDCLRKLKPNTEYEETLTLFQSIDNILTIPVPSSIKPKIDSLEESKNLLNCIVVPHKADKPRKTQRAGSIAFREVANRFCFGSMDSVERTVHSVVPASLVGGESEESKANLVKGDRKSLKKLVAEELDKTRSALFIDMNEITGIKRLEGSGTRNLFTGTYRDAEVLVKATAFANSTPQELSTLPLLRHPNLSLFIGTGITPKQALCVITEFGSGGTLSQLLRDESVPLSWKQRAKVCLDTARGVNAMHSHRPSVVHGELRTETVVLVEPVKGENDSIITKVGMMRGEEREVRCVAPEELRGGECTMKGDVYSFGILMWEVITRKAPYEGMESEEIADCVINGGRPDEKAVPEDCPSSILELMKACWHDDFLQRPSFDEIIKLLKQPL
eukprot:TRINITY_DN7003_c0_g1_i4.p1 TRINITY_DN7003_c0_g1~~TRINITY_DN7003_c0_g1_i4.p1  ORF type:complete len:544 (-),score=136.52 TRINITY_DN7003_c0_g1_i4:23-1654(-)